MGIEIPTLKLYHRQFLSKTCRFHIENIPIKYQSNRYTIVLGYTILKERYRRKQTCNLFYDEH